MAVSVVKYRVTNMDFIRLVGARKGHVYSLKFLEKLSGLTLHKNTPEILAQWGYVRVCKDCPNSHYRK